MPATRRKAKGGGGGGGSGAGEINGLGGGDESAPTKQRGGVEKKANKVREHTCDRRSLRARPFSLPFPRRAPKAGG
jgi:hypothetical protein